MKINKNFSYIYNMYREQILYIVFGVLTTAISIALYWLLTEQFKINFLLGNILSWIISVAFAFFTNRKWVFAADKNGRGFVTQLLSFYGGRVITLAAEEIILWIFIDIIEFPNMPVKIFAQITVIILNYVISKFIVFKK